MVVESAFAQGRVKQWNLTNMCDCHVHMWKSWVAQRESVVPEAKKRTQHS